MSVESTPEDPVLNQEAADEVIAESKAASAQQAAAESDAEDETPNPAATGGTASSATAKKKKSKKKKIKDALTGKSGEAGPSKEKDDISKAVGGLSKSQISDLLSLNPALAEQLGVTDGNMSDKKVAEMFKKLNLEEIMTGLAANGKNVKDMASYKFWQTQPVPKLGEKNEVVEEGPFKIVDIDQVPKQPGPLVDGFEWVTMDLTQDSELKEVYELLYGHFVEDDHGQFRFNYSVSFLKWALLSPGWTKEWHVGVRATASRKLVAFISGVPVELRVRQKVLHASEINFLCIHKKLRAKRLAPVLIKEITRRCYLQKTWQAIYTAGVVLPKPVSTCRYFHRSLNWQKLYEVGFSPMPRHSTVAQQIRNYKLPEKTSTKGLRQMEAKDLDAVLALFKSYMGKFDMAPVFTKEEIDHWMLHKNDAPGDRVVWTYVVEDPDTKEITDFFSFYGLESSVIGNEKHNNVRAAYVFYYASTVGLTSTPPGENEALKTRLNALVNDALILAKKFKFDVFNALTLMDNSLFLEQQKFGAGDGQLHYYLYNYNTNPIAGGVNRSNNIDQNCSGVGMVML
ncbi:glycylpeptide N-tetradecanoyltransferase [Coleophoma cylindrospora]|uniref:Glycylpeptide N-tetradecanoyltransferase n=1 Tax=Coleophoma cylindrospora TaxID=1849047 RepID=A0A3D8S8P9_9HELO|nr:glycylpeptide N-tetradecanoyltransferase [Coleophoma cylindrospora]